MEDTCSPGKNKVTQSFRIYSILIPCLVGILILEIIYIVLNIPTSTLGNALTIKGSLPMLPPGLTKKI
jgi:hypothetical protein